MQKNRLAAVGGFVIVGGLLFAVGLFFIGDRRMLFAETFEVYAEFSRVAGLQNGATVRVAGMNAGEVEAISLPASPSAPFRVRMRVRQDLHPLIRLDSVASIQNDGLVGNKFVQIESGTDASPPVPTGGTIQSREPFDLADMLNRVNETIDMVTETITDLRVGLDAALSSVVTTAGDAQTLIGDVGTDLREIAATGQKVAGDLQGIVEGIREGRGSVGKLMNDDAFYERLKAHRERGGAGRRQPARGDRHREGRAGRLPRRRQGRHGRRRRRSPGVAGGGARDADRPGGDIRSAEAQLPLPRLLQPPRLLRPRRHERGAVSRGHPRERRPSGAAHLGRRAACCSRTDANGTETLTDDGRQRLDSAIAPFLKYPPDTPFVIEGYADAVTRDAEFLLSRTRAQLVRDYLVRKYSLSGGAVAIMAMGSEAHRQPGGRDLGGCGTRGVSREPQTLSPWHAV